MAQLICRNCDVPYVEEPDSPNPEHFRLFKCPTCGHRLGVLASTHFDATGTKIGYNY